MVALDQKESRTKGFVYAILAFGSWGLLPIYWKMLQVVPAFQILCHRVVWSAVFLFLILLFLKGRWAMIREAFRSRSKLFFLVGSALLIFTNWLIYIWAVSAERILETSLGYFINPLVSVLLGVLFFRERLRRYQILALVLATAGVINLATQGQTFPWVALVLAFSFGTYGLLKKMSRSDSISSLWAETLLLTPVALLALYFLELQAVGYFGGYNLKMDLLLMGAGVITALPLVWFGACTRHLPLSTIGFVQYLAPSLNFLLAVFVYREPFTTQHLVTFLLIWTAVGLFMMEEISKQKRPSSVIEVELRGNRWEPHPCRPTMKENGLPEASIISGPRE